MKIRPAHAHADAIRAIKAFAEAGKNLKEPILHAVKAPASLQEICDVIKAVWGVYHTGRFLRSLQSTKRK